MMKDIFNKESYFTEFSKWNSGSKVDSFPNDKLCEIALATRNFEIELYWKRTTYYWAFCAAIIAAFALVYTKSDASLATFTILAVLATCGTIFSLGWYLANRGSKYWQENWEDHIGILINEHYGPIFKILKYPNQIKIWGLGGYPFSVSKINQITSGTMTFVWIVLFIFSLCKICDCKFLWLKDHPAVIVISFIILLLAITIVLFRQAESGHWKAYSKQKEKKPLFYKYE